MRSKIFACILKVFGIPVFLVKWILKSIWFLTFGVVGVLYKAKLISGVLAGKKAYTLTSVALLVCVLVIVSVIKNAI